MLHQLDHFFIPFCLLKGLLTVAIYYIPVLLMAWVSNCIANHDHVSYLIVRVLVGLSLHFGLKAVQIKIKQRLQITSEHLSQYYESLVSRKNLTMDYAQLESPQTKALQGQIKADRSWGSGFWGITACVQTITNQIMGIVISAIILFPLGLQAVQEKNMWFIISIFATLIVAIGTSLFFMLWYENKEGEKFSQMTMEEQQSRFHFLNEGGNALTYSDIKEIQLYGASELIGNSIQYEQSKVKVHTNAISRLNMCGGAVRGIGSGGLLALSYTTVLLFQESVAVGFVIQYAQAVFQLTSSLAALLQELASFHVSADRLMSTLTYLDTKVDMEHATVMPPCRPRTIQFQDVSFTYPGTGCKAIDKLNLTFSTTERVAIVGLNGSGKTTLVKLLCRLYEPNEGCILLDGVNIKEYEKSAYQALFATVFQDFSLFSFSVGNVIASCDHYDDKRVHEVLDMVQLKWDDSLDRTIYKTFDQDGREISGGEAQKLAIARAIYHDSPIIILDEPTAALDPLAEYEVYSQFEKLAKNKGVFFISHRMSSCRFCDKIFVMEQGKVIEQGSHFSLLENNGRYAQLWESQAQYYRTSI